MTSKKILDRTVKSFPGTVATGHYVYKKRVDASDPLTGQERGKICRIPRGGNWYDAETVCNYRIERNGSVAYYCELDAHYYDRCKW